MSSVKLSLRRPSESSGEVWRDQLSVDLPRILPAEVLAIWPEYKEEAEHQDGYEYWLKFDNPQQLDADIKLYQENS